MQLNQPKESADNQ